MFFFSLYFPFIFLNLLLQLLFGSNEQETMSFARTQTNFRLSSSLFFLLLCTQHVQKSREGRFLRMNTIVV